MPTIPGSPPGPPATAPANCAVLAAGVVLGLGASLTLAAWDDPDTPGAPARRVPSTSRGSTEEPASSRCHRRRGDHPRYHREPGQSGSRRGGLRPFAVRLAANASTDAFVTVAAATNRRDRDQCAIHPCPDHIDDLQRGGTVVIRPAVRRRRSGRRPAGRRARGRRQPVRVRRSFCASQSPPVPVSSRAKRAARPGRSPQRRPAARRRGRSRCGLDGRGRFFAGPRRPPVTGRSPRPPDSSCSAFLRPSPHYWPGSA